jgi:Zn finger protein HypA/HybF involved in hydrogenase expression
MYKSANLYFCRSCDEPHTSIDLPKKCKKCGSKDFDKLEGVTATISVQDLFEDQREDARVN